MTETIELLPCHDCAATPGSLHTPGCDAETCALCGGQAIGCDCVYEVNGFNRCDLETEHPDIYSNGPTPEMEALFDEEITKCGGRIPWSGEAHDNAACREFGLYVRFVEGVGWERVTVSHPEAELDLNRIARYPWSRELRGRVAR